MRVRVCLLLLTDPACQGKDIKLVLVACRYDNANMFWWVLLPLGPRFGNGSLVRIGYGSAGVGNPEQTYGLNCKAADATATLVKRRTLQLDPTSPGCFSYTGQNGDYVSGLADLFELDILQLIADNAARGVFTFADADGKQPELQTPLAGQKLHVCGILPALFDSVVQLGEWPELFWESFTSARTCGSGHLLCVSVCTVHARFAP